MPKIGELFIDISANNSKLRANLAEASSLIRDWSLLVTGLTAGITNAFKTIVDIGIKGLTLSITAMVATFALAAKSGADFEDAMVRTFTILKESSETVSATFTTLTDKARTLGRDTLFSATQAAQGMQILAKSGFDAREILDSITPVLNLAIVGNLELGQAANFAVSALRGFNLETDQAGRVSDVLALASSKANTTISELGSALSFVAPVAAGAGLSLEETVGALGLLANAGIKASRAGTTLRRAITVLLAPTGRAKKIMDELGLSFLDATGNVKPLTQVIRELNDAGVTAAQTMQIFGLRAGPGLIALMRAGAGAIGNFEDQLEGASGAADRMAQNFRTTVIGRTKDLIASIVDLGLAFSEEFKKPLADTIFAIRNFIVNIVNLGNRTGVFKSIIKGLGEVLEPLKNLISDLNKRFLNFLSDLTPQAVLEFFDQVKQKVQEFIDSLTSGLINKVLQELVQSLKTIASAAIFLGKVINAPFKQLSEDTKASIISVGLLTIAFVSLFGGVLNIIILIIALGALLPFVVGKLLALPVIGIAIKIAFGGILILFKGILAIALVLAGVLAVFTLVKFVSELETVSNFMALIKASWDQIVATIDVAVKGAKAFKLLGISKDANEAFNLAKETFALRQGTINELQKEREEAIANDLVTIAEGANKESIVGALKQSISEIGDLFGVKLEGVLGDMAGIVGDQTGPLAGIGKEQKVVANFDGIEIDLSGTGDEIVSGLIKLEDATRENDAQVIRVFGNILSVVESINEKVDSNTSRLNNQEIRSAGLTRQGVKPEEDRQNKSSLGASIE